MKKRTIPSAIGRYTPEQQHGFNVAVKENLEIIHGLRSSKIKLLAEDASQEEIVAKINEIIERLQ